MVELPWCYITWTTIFTLFHIVGLYDFFPWQLSRFTRLKSLPTDFTGLVICLSTQDWSCMNIGLFCFTTSKSDWIIHLLHTFHIALHVWTIWFLFTSFQQTHYKLLLVFVHLRPASAIVCTTLIRQKQPILQTIFPTIITYIESRMYFSTNMSHIQKHDKDKTESEPAWLLDKSTCNFLEYLSSQNCYAYCDTQHMEWSWIW